MTLENAAIADSLVAGRKLALGSTVLAYTDRVLHDIVLTDLRPRHGGPLWVF